MSWLKGMNNRHHRKPAKNISSCLFLDMRKKTLSILLSSLMLAVQLSHFRSRAGCTVPLAKALIDQRDSFVSLCHATCMSSQRTIICVHMEDLMIIDMIINYVGGHS